LDNGANCYLVCKEKENENKNETARYWIKLTPNWKTEFPSLAEEDKNGEWQTSAQKVKPPKPNKPNKPRPPTGKPGKGSGQPQVKRNAIMALLQNLKASTF
jgi:hypothetical protein